jgi:hypothetical protein
MNLASAIALHEVAVGDPVTVDGMTSRGVVVKKTGRRVTVQFQDWRGGAGYKNGFTVTKDQAFIHKLGKGPGE